MSVLLLFVNGIYVLRAVTEERHLSRDPVYRSYAAWMSQHSLIGRLKPARWFPRSLIRFRKAPADPP
jgi:hypothetical protein